MYSNRNGNSLECSKTLSPLILGRIYSSPAFSLSLYSLPKTNSAVLFPIYGPSFCEQKDGTAQSKATHHIHFDALILQSRQTHVNKHLISHPHTFIIISTENLLLSICFTSWLLLTLLKITKTNSFQNLFGQDVEMRICTQQWSYFVDTLQSPLWLVAKIEHHIYEHVLFSTLHLVDYKIRDGYKP